jgi:Tol biopolymer transport system component
VAAAPVQAAFPGEAGLIAYSFEEQIYTVDPDEDDPPVQITTEGVNRSPSWSPDGARLAWACDRDVCIADADGSNVERLTGPAAEENRPSWSPDGRWIVFARLEPVPDPFEPDESFIYKLEVSDPDNVVQLTSFSSGDPEWSPDGKLIAFLAGRGIHRGTLSVMRPDGSRQRTINERYAQGATPSWSSDGRRIVMLGKRRNTWRVVMLSRDGRLLDEFGRRRTSALGVAWSPDTKRIVYVGRVEGQEDLVVARPDGTKWRLVGEGRAPDWQPL